MEFLKEILGEEFYNQFSEKINAYNGNEANKEKQIKLGNLASGEYVGKGKYDALNEQLTGKQTELDTANGLIADLKKGNKDNEELQGKITTYETQITELQKQLQETKIKSAVKVALMSEKAVDVDYLAYKLSEKLKEKNETLELDENDNIKGWDDKLSGLKTQFPNMFATSQGDGKKILDPNRLRQSDGRETIPTKEEFAKMNYEQRVELKNNNEQVYRQLAKN